MVSSAHETPTDLYVPGKVCYIFADGKGDYHSAMHDGTLPMLATIMPSTTLLVDHLATAYATAVGAVQPNAH